MKKLLSSILPFVACILCFNAQTTEIQYLSGYGDNPAVEWEFMCSDGNNSGKWTTIKVPSCWELQGFGTYQYGQSIGRGAAGVASETGLYKYKFRLPEAWNGKIIKLVFDGVMTDCSVTLNGRPAVKLHQGAFYRFEADVTDRIFTGKKENLLEVSVSKESANPSVNAAERRGDYWNFGGIFRPVFVKAMPAQHIDRLAVDAQADGSFKAEIFLGYAVNNNAKIRVSFSDFDGKNIGIAEYPVPNGSDKTLITHKLSNVKQWTAETPNLYSATFSLVVDGKTQHARRDVQHARRDAQHTRRDAIGR
ncbi:MAG: hypothetical protein LBN23_01970 [Paludibacter sp.]|jgi:beta-galactosidase/beta-glucuronidase|nr:hypothetical protein [Paludibacter sp.]